MKPPEFKILAIYQISHFFSRNYFMSTVLEIISNDYKKLMTGMRCDRNGKKNSHWINGNRVRCTVIGSADVVKSLRDITVTMNVTYSFHLFGIYISESFSDSLVNDSMAMDYIRPF